MSRVLHWKLIYYSKRLFLKIMWNFFFSFFILLKYDNEPAIISIFLCGKNWIFCKLWERQFLVRKFIKLIGTFVGWCCFREFLTQFTSLWFCWEQRKLKRKNFVKNFSSWKYLKVPFCLKGWPEVKCCLRSKNQEFNWKRTKPRCL